MQGGPLLGVGHVCGHALRQQVLNLLIVALEDCLNEARLKTQTKETFNIGWWLVSNINAFLKISWKSRCGTCSSFIYKQPPHSCLGRLPEQGEAENTNKGNIQRWWWFLISHFDLNAILEIIRKTRGVGLEVLLSLWANYGYLMLSIMLQRIRGQYFFSSIAIFFLIRKNINAHSLLPIFILSILF